MDGLRRGGEGVTRVSSNHNMTDIIGDGFFYEEEEKEARDKGIAERVISRQQGCHHQGGGHME